MFSLTQCQRSANSYAPEICIFKIHFSCRKYGLTLRKSEYSKMFEKTFIPSLSSIIHKTTPKKSFEFFFLLTNILNIYKFFMVLVGDIYFLVVFSPTITLKSALPPFATYLLLELAARSNLSFQELKANKHFLLGEAGSRSTILIHVRSFPGPTKLHTNGNDTPKKKNPFGITILTQ